MAENLVSISIDESSMSTIMDAIQTINDNLPKLISITKEEKIAMPKMGDKTVAFVAKALEYAQQNTNITPGFLDIEEFRKDVQAVAALNKVLHPLQQLVEKLEDTVTVAGSEAYVAALTFYSALKNAVRLEVPGVKTIMDDLSSRFPGRGKVSK